MPNHSRSLLALVTGLSLSLSALSGALAQTAPAPKPAAPPAAVDPATLKIAREVVGQMQGDRETTLNGMAAPMAGMMQGLGVRDPERTQAIVKEVVLPLLKSHWDEFLDIQAASFAGVLSKEDLQAIGTFYATPAGRRLAAAQPQLAQAQMTGTTRWIQGLMPEMQAKMMEAVKASGGASGAKPK